MDEGQKRKLLHNMTLCARCGQCWRICPEDAIEFRHLLQGDWDTVITLDIIRCKICGEPVYTTAFGAKVAEKIDEEVNELCPRHRQRISMSVWPLLFPRKVKTGGVKK
jgi:ferredoxin hydrogenase large subunit